LTQYPKNIEIQYFGMEEYQTKNSKGVFTYM